MLLNIMTYFVHQIEESVRQLFAEEYHIRFDEATFTFLAITNLFLHHYSLEPCR